jgi:negative regulator of flagellin synthesis FlgM
MSPGVAMKVNESSPIRPPGHTPGKPERRDAVEHGGDRVSTTETARTKAIVAEAARTASAGRATQLAAIEAAVRQGTFTPDPQRIAQRILDAAELSAKLQALLRR